jgi:hypothetical protein
MYIAYGLIQELPATLPVLVFVQGWFETEY